MSITDKGYAHPDALVSTDWVAEHMQDPNVRLVESNEDPLVYPSGHIPGAVQIDWTADLNDPLRRDYIAAKDFAALVSRFGITPDTTVVLYGDRNNWWACYAFWVFQLFGHTNAVILDGGRLKWEKEGRPLTRDVPTFAASTYPVPAARQDAAHRAFREQVLTHSEAGGTTPVDPRLEENGVERQFPGPEPDVVTDAALRFLEQEPGRPFALSLHYRAPHTPYGPVPDQDMAPFRDAQVAIPVFPGLDQAQVRQWTREYYASIHSVDRNIGRLLDRLQQSGLDRTTVVVFTSDHGYNIGHHGLHTKGNGTWIAGGVNGPTMPNMFDTSLRPPFLVRGPGVAGAGRVVNELVAFEDVYPTLLAIAGLPLPAGAPTHGRDLTPLLRGESLPQWRDAVYGQYDIHHYAIAHLRMVRETRWKLVRSYGTTTKDQLYDLEADPGERRNLWAAPEQRERRVALERRLREWMASIDDPVLKERGLLYQPAP